MAFYCAGNWKMNKGPHEATEFIQQLKRETSINQAELVLLPPALTAWQVSEGVRGTSLAWGGQNCYVEAKGAFTGENSAQVLKAMGARFCLVGHSERRQIFLETDELVGKKVQSVQAQGLTPILCLGETLQERQSGQTAEVILRQLRAGLKRVDPNVELWLAYEPVWAIGTGKVATPVEVQEAHEILRRALREWNASIGDKVPILYGGSAKPDNVVSLCTLPNVNGFLIGGASLAVEDFVKIHRLATQSLTAKL